ncbi:MAG: TolC family protein [Campylobacterota bacterium]|nr:TolC family protein [Campylobacterota bacterium]
MIKTLFLIVPLLVQAESLKSLLEYSMGSNSLVISKTLNEKAKTKELESKQNAYFPTLDAGMFYRNMKERSLGIPGVTYSGYAKISLDIYDGGYKSSLVKQKNEELKSSRFETEALKKSLSLSIIQDFYTAKSLNATLVAREDAKKSLQAQLSRMEKFYAAKVATKDDVDRLRAAFDTNIYEIESIKFQILSIKQDLELKVGKKITSLDNSTFRENIQNEYEKTDVINSMMAQKESILNAADSLSSIYYPQIRVEDTYSLYGYENSDRTHPGGVDRQNVLLLSANIRLYDNATLKRSQEVVLLNAQALNSEINYKNREQKMQLTLAKSRILTSKTKIKSALSALVSAKSAFVSVEKKYAAGVVDNVVYLDALTAKTNAVALYETSKNDLEIAYAIYYYYSGKNVEEYLQ